MRLSHTHVLSNMEPVADLVLASSKNQQAQQLEQRRMHAPKRERHSCPSEQAEVTLQPSHNTTNMKAVSSRTKRSLSAIHI